jgi:hypothetical protein
MAAGLGGALGAGLSTAATGGSPTDSIINAGLGGVGGYMAGPSIAGMMSPAGSTPAGFGLTANPGGSVALDGLTKVGSLPNGLTPALSGTSAPSLMPSMDTMQKAGLGVMMAGQIGSLINPQPQPFRGSGPVSGPQFSPNAVNTQQFMIPPSAPVRFSLA